MNKEMHRPPVVTAADLPWIGEAGGQAGWGGAVGSGDPLLSTVTTWDSSSAQGLAFPPGDDSSSEDTQGSQVKRLLSQEQGRGDP